MKRVTLTVLAVLISFSLTNIIFGQEITAKGIRVGGSRAIVAGDYTDNYDGLSPFIGFSIGGYIKLKIRDNLEIQPEILLSQKGYAYDYGSSGSTGSDLNYIDIPVFLTFEPNAKLNLYAGPYLGLFISGENWTNTGSGNNTTELESDDVNGMDFGLTFGAGTEISRFTLDGRYNLGMKEFIEKDVDLKNRQLVLLIGYSF